MNYRVLRKRIASILMSVSMLLTSCPVSVLAESEFADKGNIESEAYDSSEESNIIETSGFEEHNEETPSNSEESNEAEVSDSEEKNEEEGVVSEEENIEEIANSGESNETEESIAEEEATVSEEENGEEESASEEKLETESSDTENANDIETSELQTESSIEVVHFGEAEEEFLEKENATLNDITNSEVDETNEENPVYDQSSDEVKIPEDVFEFYPLTFSMNSVNTIDAWWDSIKNDARIEVAAEDLILLSNLDVDLSGKTIYLKDLGGDYVDLTGEIELGGTTYTFQGLGSENNPFNATIESRDTEQGYGILLNRALFNYLDASTKIVNLKKLKLRSMSDGATMLADHISKTADDSWKALPITIEKGTVVDGGTTYEYYPGTLIGEISENAGIELKSVTYSEGATIDSSDNAGLLCNTMKTGSSLSFETISISGDAKITAGDNYSAGGLIGDMGSSAKLSVTDKVTIGSNFTITGGNTGGVIGKGTDVIISGLNATVDGVLIKPKTAGGGIFGKYITNGTADTYNSYSGGDTSSLNATAITCQASNSSAYVGGIIGILDLNGDFSITDAKPIVTLKYQINVGGLVGNVMSSTKNTNLRVLTISGENEVSLDNTNIKLSSCGAAVGVAGTGDNASDIGVYVALSGSLESTVADVSKLTDSKQYYGGFIAKLMANSVAEIADGATLTPSTNSKNIKFGGGVVGYAAKGSTVRLAGTTDLGEIQFSADYVQTAGSEVKAENFGGQIVGVIDSALVYGAKTWVLKRPTTVQAVDDIGNYGTVIRLGKNIGQGASMLGTEGNGLSEDLITQDATTHKTVFKETLSGFPVKIGSEDQFALVAIAEQTTGYFKTYTSVNPGAYLLNSTGGKGVEFIADIDLRNTGLSGLQTDILVSSYGYWAPVNGNKHTITLAIGEIYGIRESGTVSVETAGSGQIHKHSHVGLFSKFNGTKVSDLTIDGTINVWECTGTTKYVGGFAAYNWGGNGDTKFSGVSTKVTINCFGLGDKASEIGGLIGHKQGGTLQINSLDYIGRADNSYTSTCNTVINGNNNTEVYFGGLVGYNTGNATISNVTLGGSITMGAVTDARVGGLIAKTNANSTIYLNTISIDGQTVTTEASSTCGGLLGFDWQNNIVFGKKDTHNDGITVKGTSAIAVNGTADSGALVYTARGYWQVNHVSLQKMNVTSGTGALGLLVCKGKNDGGNGGIYLELTNADSYTIDGTNVNITSSGGDFDEICTYTCKKGSAIYGNGNSVISIATANNLVDETEGNSYQNRTTNNGTTWSFQPNNRYYYNLHLFRENANGAIDTPGELTLWAAYQYSFGAIDASLLGVNDAIKGMIIGPESGNVDINLTGYSYYPINIDNKDITIKNCTITFANATIESSEASGGTDTLVRTTQGSSSSHTPHFLMHTGLTINFANTSTVSSDNTRTFTVKNVTLAGNVGKTLTDFGGSGVLISRNLSGQTANGANHIAKLDIDGLTLSGLYINADKGAGNYAPLLVNNGSSYINITAKNITTENYLNYNSNEVPAATSLIGKIGGANASYINLAFEGIDLSGRVGSWAESTAISGARTGGSIFSHATLLEKFQYSDAASSGYYHFVKNDKYTYGKEISETKENIDLQKNFYNTDDAVKDVDNTDFSSGYLPYVCETNVTNPGIASTFHELEINVVKPDLDRGCGTYDDPYIIYQAAQLTMLAKFVKTGSAQNGWKVSKVDNPEAILTASDDNHTEYAAGSSNWDDDNMRKYLLGAYYKIDPENGADTLELTTFAGLGTNDNPFVGVIEGNGKTLSINAEKCNGLINISNGSVVRNLTLQYKGTVVLDGIVAPSGTAAADVATAGKNTNIVYDNTFFGGIIGTVKGGDNIIENVAVSFVNTGENAFGITLGDERHCAGGFVGLVQGGGVVLKNMPSQNGLSGTALYRDKYFGRVLDGYVINETSQTGVASTFTGSNYSVPDIDNTNANTSKLVWNNGTINIACGQQLVMLCDIVNSGAANGGGSDSYKSGAAKVRNADYSKIGNISSASDTAFLASRKDDIAIGLGNTNYPYLVTRYTDEAAKFFTACNGISLEFKSNIDLSAYGNGYRSIGGRYNCSANDGYMIRNNPLISAVSGDDVLLTIAIDQKESRDDNFLANAVGGLFNVLYHNGATVEKITINGSVKISSGLEQDKNATGDLLIEHASVGGFVGRDYSANDKTLQLDNLCFGQSTSSGNMVYGESHTGGIIGYAGSKAFNPFGLDSRIGDDIKPGKITKNGSIAYLVDCSYNNIEIVGGESSGGLVGRVSFNSKYLGGFHLTSDNITNKTFYIINNDTVTVSGLNIIRNFARVKAYETTYVDEYSSLSKEETANGVGCFIGVSANSCVIGNDEYPINISGIKVYGLTSFTRTGGIIGFLTNNGNGNNCATSVRNVHLSGIDVGNYKANGEPNIAADNAGGLIGTWWQKGGLIMKNCSITASNIFGVSVGGIIGYFDKSTANISDIKVDDCRIFSTTNGYVGGIVGNASKNSDNKNNKNTLFWNITVSNNVFKNQGNYNGMVFGYWNGYVNMHYVLLKNNKFESYNKNNDTKYGRIAGFCSQTRVIGLSVIQSEELLGYLPTRDSGSNGYNWYIDPANGLGNKQYFIYDAYQNPDITEASQLATHPTVTIPGIENILGDTLTPDTVIAAAADKKRYPNVDIANQINSDNSNLVVSDIVTTYNEQQNVKLLEADNFEAILIDGDASVIRQYINAATNGGYEAILKIENWWNTRTTQRMRMTVSIDRYRYDSEQNRFVKADDLRPTLVYHKDTGEFTTTAQYDNQIGTFTMITIKMLGEPNKDQNEGTPAERAAVTRTIHIPVIVRRMLQVDFTATMASGTVFNASEMDQFTTHALASAGDDITGYLTFRYNSICNVEQNFDWQNYLEAGGNLLGAFNKTVDTGLTELPAGTVITLLDCQNNDRRYLATISEGQSSELELFSTGNLSFVNGDGESFSPCSLSYLLQITATEDATGSWVRLSDSTEATVSDSDGYYYRLKQDTETDGTFYNLKVNNNSPEENYFVIICVPIASNYKLTFEKSGMKWNSEGTAPPVEVHQIHRYNSKPEGTGVSEASFNYLDNYVQNLEDRTDAGGVPVLANTAVVELPVVVTDEVTFDSKNYESTDELYEQLVVRLKKTEAEASTEVIFPSDAHADNVKLYAYYIDGSGIEHYFTYNSTTGKLVDSGSARTPAISYDWTCDDDGIMRLPFATNADNGTSDCIDLGVLREAAKVQQKFYLEAEANVQISYNSVFANSTIPANDTAEISNYTQVDVTSYLSFTKSGLSYSTVKATTAARASTDIRKYYLQQKHEAVLTFDYVNLDQLGINPRDLETSTIDTTLTLDLSSVDGFNTDISKFELLKNTTSVTFTFTLKKKINGGNYEDVEISEYHSGTSLEDGGYSLTIEKEEDGTWPYYNAVTGTFSVPVSFTVNTVSIYANYQIHASVALSSEEAFSANTEKAFITYTLAKINVNGVWPSGT